MSDKYGNPDPIGDIFRSLYGDKAVTSAFNKANYFASGLPLVGGLFSTVDNYRYYDDYLRNSGLSWADVKYPARMSIGGYGSTVSYFSSNIKRLYE